MWSLLREPRQALAPGIRTQTADEQLWPAILQHRQATKLARPDRLRHTCVLRRFFDSVTLHQIYSCLVNSVTGGESR